MNVRERIIGSKEKNTTKQSILQINCSLCIKSVKSQGDYRKELACFLCLIDRVMVVDNNVKAIEINKIYKMPYEDVLQFLNLSKFVKDIEDKGRLFVKKADRKCFGLENYCLFPEDLTNLKKSFTNQTFFEHFDLKPVNVADLSRRIYNRKCRNCLKKSTDALINLNNPILRFREEFAHVFDKESLDHNNYQRIQEEMIGPVPIQSLNRNYNLQPIDLKEFSNKNKILINSYDICSDLIYISQIYYIEEKMEPLYTISNIFSDKELEAVLNIRPTIFSELDKMNFFYEKDLGNVIETLEKEISNMMSRLISMEDPIFRRRTIRYLATNYVKIDEIFPLLLDNYIEEIFMDSIDDYIYINHQVYGRCRTLIQVRLETVNALKTHIRLESRERLDREHSSIVFVIQNKFFHCRFSIDVAPIHAENLCLDIRKVNKRTFTLIDLIINNTITVEIAAFLYFCIRRRINVTVVGETDSGKTTLINALDLLVPLHFRKIYLEDVVESLDQKEYDMHQLKYVVSGGAEYTERSKASQIKKLLHRSPDFVYLGEILTKEECESMFHCLSAGLKGMQTCHGFDIYSIITRWEIHFGIPKLCFNDLGIVITMKKFDNKRIVTGIYELEYNDSDLIIREFFVYNPFKSNWEKRSSLNESKMFRQITTIEALSGDAIEDEINQISNHLNGFVKRGDFLNQDIKGIIQLFEKFDLSLRRKVTNNEVSEYLDDSQLDLSSYADDSQSNWFTIEEKGRE